MNLLPRRGSDAVSPTAHYTGHVWGRNGLSHPELATFEGRLLFDALEPWMAVNRLVGGATLEGLLLARHRVIDDLLAEAIDDSGVGQVIEVAAGMSPRGWRFTQRYGDELVYIEADLPAMARRKREALERMGSLGDRHRVVELDALKDDGPRSIAAIASSLEAERGLAIITEGLLTYFPDGAVLGMWQRFGRELRRFRAGLYLSDLRLGDRSHGLTERAFRAALSSFVQRRVHTHFTSEEDAIEQLRNAGFAEATLHRASEHAAAGDAARDAAAARIHIVEART